jgi:hypothetical protein
MKPTKTLLKLGAVLSSITLMGAFVAYQAGTFNGLRATRQKDLQKPQSDPSNVRSVDVESAQKPAPSDEEADAMMQQAEKAAKAAVEQKPAPTPEQLQTILMSTSKSLSPGDHFKGLIPVTAPPPAASQPPPPPPTQPAPVLMPGSKAPTYVVPPPSIQFDSKFTPSPASQQAKPTR